MYVLCDVRFAPIPINDYSNGCLMGFLFLKVILL